MGLKSKTKAELIKEIHRLEKELKKKPVPEKDDFPDPLFILEHLPAGFILFDSKKILFINGKASRILGLGKKLTAGSPEFSPLSFICPADQNDFKKWMKKAGSGVCDFFIRTQTPAKKTTDVEMRLCSVKVKNKKLFAAQLCEAGIRLKEKKEADDFKNDFNLILSSIDEVVYYVEEGKGKNKGAIRYVSDQINRIIGIDKSDYLKNPHKFFRQCHPEDVPRLLEVAEKIKREKKPIKARYRFRHFRTGQYIWLEERIFPQLNAKKEHVGNFSVTRDITTEKDFEQKLMESETRFRLLAENANDIIFKYNYFPSPHYEYVSPSVEKVLGFSPGEFYSNPSLGRTVMHPGDMENVDFRGQEEKSHAPVTRTSRFYHKAGHLVWLETSYSFFRNKKGDILSVQGISRDVTRERESELRIEENERKFRLLAENAMDIIFHYKFLDEPGYTYMSPSVTKILGYTPEDFYRDPYLGYKILLPEDRPFMEDSEKNTREKNAIKKEVSEMTLRYLSKDGKVVWLQTTYSHIKDKDGRIVELEGISRDITRQKESELALSESERKLNSLLGNLPGMAYRCLYDQNWTMLFASQGTRELTGYEPEEFINNAGLPFSKIVHPEDILLGRPEIEKAIKNKTAFEIEFRIIDKEGEIKWVWEKGEGVFSPGGQLLFIEGFISDISHRKKIEQELNQKWINFKSLVETTPDGIFILQQYKVVYANPAALRIIEAPGMEEMAGLNLFEFVLPEYHSLVKERLERAIAGENFDYFHEYKVKTLKGKILEVEVRSIPIIFNGKFALQIIFHDLTAQKQLEHQQIRTQLAEEANRKLQEEIQERKKVESELRQTQKFTRLLIDSSLDMICAADKEGRIIEFNYAAQQAFGYTYEEAIGRPLTMLYANVKDRVGILSQMVEREVPFSGEVINKRKNGETFISYLSATTLKNEKGEVIGSMGVSRDITKLKMDELMLRENEERYRAIYNQAFIGIARVDIYSGKFIEVNLRLCEILGYTKEELIEKTTYELTVKEDREKLSLSDQLSTDGFFVQRRYLHRNGSIVYMNLSYSLVKDVANNPLYFVVVYDDITRNKIYEQELLSQSSKLKAIFESSSHLVWTVNRDYEITSYNNNFLDAIKDKYRITPTLNRRLQDYLDTKEALSYSKEWITRYENIFAGNKVKFEKFDRNSRGEEIFREVFLHPIYNDKNEVVEIACIAHDITERKFFERQIMEQSAQLKAIFNSSSHIIWTVTRDFQVTSYNDNFFKRISGNRDSFHTIQDNEGLINPKNPNYQEWISNYEKAFSGKGTHFETRTQSLDNQPVWTEIFLEPIVGIDGKVKEVSGIAHDITEKKLAEEQIRQSLKEKEVLLKEVHHRVKNNLQVISSILNLQSSYVKDQVTLNLLKECQNRIKSMAFIHESLYQNKDFSNINFSEYLVMLAKNLLHSYGLVENRIKLFFDTEPIALNLDLSIPCGLIVNEIISNALKYAFPGEREGVITIKLRLEDERLFLSIGDNGIGLPEEVDFRNTESLGLQLVVTLVEQLNGEIDIDLSKGTKFLINFTYNTNKI